MLWWRSAVFCRLLFFSVALQTAKLRPNPRHTPDQLKPVYFNSDLKSEWSQEGGDLSETASVNQSKSIWEPLKHKNKSVIWVSWCRSLFDKLLKGNNKDSCHYFPTFAFSVQHKIRIVEESWCSSFPILKVFAKWVPNVGISY